MAGSGTSRDVHAPLTPATHPSSAASASHGDVEAGVRLQRADEPRSERQRRPPGAQGQVDGCAANRELLWPQRTPEEHRERHERDLRHVGARVEHRAAAALAPGHAKLAPETDGREPQPFERSAERMLGDRQPPFRGDDDAVRAEDAVRQAAAGVMERCNRRKELPEQPYRRSGVGAQRGVLRRLQQGRQSFASNELGDERELRLRLLEHGDRTHLGEQRVRERRQLVGAAANRVLEPALRGERAAKAQELQRRPRIVEQEQSLAERVGKTLGVPGDETGTGGA